MSNQLQPRSRNDYFPIPKIGPIPSFTASVPSVRRIKIWRIPHIDFFAILKLANFAIHAGGCRQRPAEQADDHYLHDRSDVLLKLRFLLRSHSEHGERVDRILQLADQRRVECFVHFTDSIFDKLRASLDHPERNQICADLMQQD